MLLLPRAEVNADLRPGLEHLVRAELLLGALQVLLEDFVVLLRGEVLEASRWRARAHENAGGPLTEAQGGQPAWPEGEEGEEGPEEDATVVVDVEVVEKKKSPAMKKKEKKQPMKEEKQPEAKAAKKNRGKGAFKAVARLTAAATAPSPVRAPPEPVEEDEAAEEAERERAEALERAKKERADVA